MFHSMSSKQETAIIFLASTDKVFLTMHDTYENTHETFYVINNKWNRKKCNSLIKDIFLISDMFFLRWQLFWFALVCFINNNNEFINHWQI